MKFGWTEYIGTSVEKNKNSAFHCISCNPSVISTTHNIQVLTLLSDYFWYKSSMINNLLQLYCTKYIFCGLLWLCQSNITTTTILNVERDSQEGMSSKSTFVNGNLKKRWNERMCRDRRAEVEGRLWRKSKQKRGNKVRDLEIRDWLLVKE